VAVASAAMDPVPADSVARRTRSHSVASASSTASSVAPAGSRSAAKPRRADVTPVRKAGKRAPAATTGRKKRTLTVPSIPEADEEMEGVLEVKDVRLGGFEEQDTKEVPKSESKPPSMRKTRSRTAKAAAQTPSKQTAVSAKKAEAKTARKAPAATPSTSVKSTKKRPATARQLRSRQVVVEPEPEPESEEEEEAEEEELVGTRKQEDSDEDEGILDNSGRENPSDDEEGESDEENEAAEKSLVEEKSDSDEASGGEEEVGDKSKRDSPENTTADDLEEEEEEESGKDSSSSTDSESGDSSGKDSDNDEMDVDENKGDLDAMIERLEEVKEKRQVELDDAREKKMKKKVDEEVASDVDDDYSSEEDADGEEMALEAAVFGNLDTSTKLSKDLETFNSKKRARPAAKPVSGGDLFFEDTEGVDDESELSAEESEAEEEAPAAWVDKDDDDVKVNIHNVSRLRKLRKTHADGIISGAEYQARLRDLRKRFSDKATWATLPTSEERRKKKTEMSEEGDEEDEEDEINDLLRSSDPLTKSDSEFDLLPPGKISISRLNDANQHGISQSVVQSTCWHRNGQLLASAGLDKKLKLFQVDGKANSLVESIYLPDMPIMNAQFTGPNHEEMICVGRRPFFYWVDLETGRAAKIPGLLGRKERSFETFNASPDGSLMSFMGMDGHVLLASQKTKQYIGSVKMNEGGNCAVFSPDGSRLLTSGDHGNVYCWDMRMRRLVYKFRDEGSVNTRSIAWSNNGRHIAVGSTNGVVNLYDSNAAEQKSNPVPLSTILNLTTAVDQLSFNHDGQLLALLSRRKKDSLRLFNVNTLSTVPNWPTNKTPIHYASCAQFSPESDMFVVGNDRGRCLLYSLHHYSSR